MDTAIKGLVEATVDDFSTSEEKNQKVVAKNTSAGLASLSTIR